MSAVLLAVFSQYGDADRVRTRLVRDGFPTDRVELTARSDRGRGRARYRHGIHRDAPFPPLKPPI